MSWFEWLLGLFNIYVCADCGDLFKGYSYMREREGNLCNECASDWYGIYDENVW